MSQGDAASPNGGSDRRKFLIRAGVGSAAAGVLWIAPQILSSDAAHATASNCTGTQGFFSWARTTAGQSYTAGQRSGAPGAGGDMLSGTGWTSHPTYTVNTATGGAATPITVTYKLSNTTYLNTGGAPDGGQGHGVSSVDNSATFKSYRVSKISSGGVAPPVGNILTITINFSALVGCPTIVLGDVDNNLPTTSSGPGCTGAVGAASPFWSDGISASGFSAVDGGGSAVGVTRIAGTGGSNLTPAAGSSGPWRPLACASIPQNSNVSDLTLQASGPVRSLQISYVSNYQDTVGTGAQHIALGAMSFYY